MSSSTASSFWKEQASETPSPKRSATAATSSCADRSSDRAARAATSSWAVVVIACGMVPVRRPPFIIATNPSYKVYGVSGDSEHVENCQRSSSDRPRPGGLRRLLAGRRGAGGGRRWQHPPDRLLDSARGLREADRPLQVRSGRRHLVRPVVRSVRRAE